MWIFLIIQFCFSSFLQGISITDKTILSSILDSETNITLNLDLTL